MAASIAGNERIVPALRDFAQGSRLVEAGKHLLDHASQLMGSRQSQPRCEEKHIRQVLFAIPPEESSPSP